MPNICPRCTASNPNMTSFCVMCRRRLPQAMRVGPRVLAKIGRAASAPNQVVQADELAIQIKPAIQTLLWLGVLHAGTGAVVGAAEFANGQGRNLIAMGIGGIVLAIGVGFLGLGYWARKNPFSATIAALSAYGTLLALAAVAAFQLLSPVQAGIGLLVPVAATAALARAVDTAVAHRALSRQAAQAPAAVPAEPVAPIRLAA
jgi:hypothetical protein